MTVTEAKKNIIADRYEVIGPPLKGGMGIVYRCKDLHKDKLVALKTFNIEQESPRTQFLTEIINEGTTWVTLGKHLNIVSCHDVVRYRNGTEVYLVLELVSADSGKKDASLLSWIEDNGKLSIQTALDFALQIAYGMRFATQKVSGLVHRDLKPANILVGADNFPNTNIRRLRVTDFGLSMIQKRTDGSMSKTNLAIAEQILDNSLTVGGTYSYMAPEQFENPKIDSRADIYAFGCILFEMISGEQLVAANSIEEFRQLHQKGRAIATAKLRPIPKDILDFLTQCLSVDPTKRFATWENVIKAISFIYCSRFDTIPFQENSIYLLRTAEKISQGWAYNTLGISTTDLGTFQESLAYFHEAQKIALKENDDRLRAASIGNLGIIYQEMGDINQAIANHEQSLMLFRNTNDQRGEVNALATLASDYKDSGDYQKAIELGEQAIEKFYQFNNIDVYGLANTMSTIGLAYRKQNKLQEAISYTQKDLEIRKQLGDSRGIARAYGNLGNIYEDLGDSEQAIKSHKMNHKISTQMGDEQSKAIACWNIGLNYENQGNFELAIDWMQKCVDYEFAINHPDAKKDAAHVRYLQKKNVAPKSYLTPFFRRLKPKQLLSVHLFFGASMPVHPQDIEKLLEDAIKHLKDKKHFSTLWNKMEENHISYNFHQSFGFLHDKDKFTRGLLAELSQQLSNDIRVELDIPKDIRKISGLDKTLFITGGFAQSWEGAFRWGVQVFFHIDTQ